jgi:N-acetylmuramoyl-L-alanine amidase
MRSINYIVLHCTATPQTTTVASIQRYWAGNLKWKNPGYHYIIPATGELIQLQPIEKPSNGVAGYNSKSIHISYIGGVDDKNQPLDNRTPAQIAAQVKILRELKAKFPDAQIKGHRDFPRVAKACPSFEVKDFIKGINLSIITLLLLICSSCVPQKMILRKIEETEKSVLSNAAKLTEIQSLIQRLDETYRTNQTILNSYEKEKIKSRLDSTEINDVLNYLRSIIPAEKSGSN